jgi:hypothetical protein
VGGDRAAAGADEAHSDVPRSPRVVRHLLPGELQRIELERELGKAREVGGLRRRAVGHRLGGKVGGDGSAHLLEERQHEVGAAQAVDAHDVRSRVHEGARRVRRCLSVGGPRLLLEGDRDHRGQPRLLRALDGEEGLSEPGESLADHEVDALLDLHRELLVERGADLVAGRRAVRLVHPGEADVAGDEAAVSGDLAGNADRGPVQLGEPVLEADRRQLVAARVEGQGL